MAQNVALTSLGEVRFERIPDSVAGATSEPSLRPLPAWTYFDAEVFAQERAAVLRASWQVACHVSDVAEPGSYLVFDLLDDSVIILRGLDGDIRGFVNACRHRGARLLDGTGRCPARLACPYHGWSYGLDGALKTVPFEDGFPGLDKGLYGLRPVELEVFHGLVFVRLEGEGPSVGELWAGLGSDLTAYRLPEMVPLSPIRTEVWACNWKVAIDNYLESYHIPIGHPGLNRLLGPSQDQVVLDSGVTRGISRLRSVEALDGDAAATWSERHYRRLLERLLDEGAFAHLSAGAEREWRNYSMLPNLGLDLYPDLVDFFQVLPLEIGRTAIRYGVYGLPDDRRAMRVLRQLNDRINLQVNLEDRELCQRVQKGLGTSGYEPGPLAAAEVCLAQLHDHIRARVPAVGG